MSIQPRIKVGIQQTTKHITWTTPNRRLRGWKGTIQIPGDREVIPCGCFHRKPKAARSCAMRQAKPRAKALGVEIAPC
jgi:hypothetical protein